MSHRLIAQKRNRYKTQNSRPHFTSFNGSTDRYRIKNALTCEHMHNKIFSTCRWLLMMLVWIACSSNPWSGFGRRTRGKRSEMIPSNKGMSWARNFGKLTSVIALSISSSSQHSSPYFSLRFSVRSKWQNKSCVLTVLFETPPNSTKQKAHVGNTRNKYQQMMIENCFQIASAWNRKTCGNFYWFVVYVRTN